MRIGIDARSLLTEQARGEGKTLLRLYQEISILKPEWEFIFYGQKNQFAPFDIKNLTIEIFNLPGFRFNSWENIGLPYHAWRDKIDVLHCTGSSAPVFSPVPVVMTVHDIIPLVFNDGMSKNQVDQFRRQLANGVRSACSIIAVSENSRRDLCGVFKIDPQKLHVIHWGTDPEDRSSLETASPDPGPHSTIPHPYILAFGGAAKRKNTDAVISAFSLLATTLPEIRLVLVGVTPPSFKEQISLQTDRLGVSNRVHMLDFVSEQELDALYRHAECLLYPSLYEGFGMPLVEAMSRGVPIIGSNTTSIPEVLGDAGILVDPENPQAIAEGMARLLTDAELMVRMKILARKRAENFSWRHTAEATIRVIEGCAGGGKHSNR